MMTLQTRLEALESRLAARHQLGRPTRQQLEDARRDLFVLLEKYSASPNRPDPRNASFMELIGHGMYEEAIAAIDRHGGEEAELEAARVKGWHLILIWEAHKQGITTDELIKRELIMRATAEEGASRTHQ